MEVKAKAGHFEEVEVTITITAPMRQWRMVEEGLARGACNTPSLQLLQSIRDSFRKLEATYATELELK